MQIVSRADAKSRGETYYFTGKPCARGHTTHRYVSTLTCLECHKENQRAFRAENPEKVRQFVRNTRRKNLVEYREKDRVAKAKWRMENPELAKERRNESVKKWAEKYPEKQAAKVAKRRASKLNATPSWLNTAEKAEIEGIYQFAQIMTMISGRPYEVDHIEPLQGKTICGLHIPWNLQVIEREANRSKGNRLPQELNHGT